MKRWSTLLLTASIVVWITCNNLWVYTSTPIYYFGIAQLIFISSLIIHVQPSKSKYQLFISRAFLFLAANNLLDEMFFNPQAFELNEYLTCASYVIYSLWTTYRK